MKTSLKLLAIIMASLTFLSCQKVSLGYEETDGDTVEVTFHAGFAAEGTKTQFLDKEGTVYPSEWTRNKQARIYVGTATAVNVTPDAEGTSTTFTASLDNASAGTALRVLSPKGNFDNSAPENNAGGFTSNYIAATHTYVWAVIPDEQTPTQFSCDESAHLVTASTVLESSLSDASDIDLEFSPVNAFGKLVLSDCSADAISSVVLSFPASVAGPSCKYMLADGSLEISSNGKSTLTLDASDLTKDDEGRFNVWFGCVPVSMTSGTFSVTVTDAGGNSTTKTAELSASKPLEFTRAKVKVINLSLAGSEPGGDGAETGTVLWSETWTGGSSGEKPSVYGFEGTTVYEDGSVTYSEDNTGTKLYNELLAGGDKPELLLKAGGTWTVSGIPTGSAASMALSLKSNKNNVTVSSPTGGISVGSSTSSGTTYSWTVANNGAQDSFTLVFTAEGSNNARIDDIILTVQEGGSGSGGGNTTTVTTATASDVSYTTATLNATYSNASAAPEYTGFYWGTDPANLVNDWQNSTTTMTSTSGSFSVGLDNLSDGVTYYYRAYIKVHEDGTYKEYVSTVLKSFTTRRISGDVSGNQLGWAELPRMNYTVSGNYKISTENSNNYYAYHWCAGGETTHGHTARNFTVCFSGEHHCPLWVAAPRHSMYVGSGRHDAYRTDDLVPASIQYRNKDTGGGCNKGHMLGSAERNRTLATNQQVFVYTNIAPQLSTGFNTGGGGWNKLEDWVDTQVCADTLYEVIGCYFERYTDGYGNTVNPETISFGGRNDVDMPTMFYYVLLRTKSGSSGKAVTDCSSSELKCAAFVRSHTNALKGQAVTRSEMMSVSELEAITGFTYFANVPDAPKSTCNPTDWGL